MSDPMIEPRDWWKWSVKPWTHLIMPTVPALVEGEGSYQSAKLAMAMLGVERVFGDFEFNGQRVVLCFHRVDDGCVMVETGEQELTASELLLAEHDIEREIE